MSGLGKSKSISSADDYIDSRDVIERIKELEAEREQSFENSGDFAGFDESEEGEELAALKALEQECNYGDWKYGAQLIRDDKFEDHARELAEDIGAIGRDDPWPTNHIDWDAACDALKMDYSSVDFDGTTYWVRS